MQREPERQDQHIELTVAQEQVAHSIINSLNAAQGTRKFIVLEGLPGVGKTTLLESIEESVVLHGGRIVDPNDIRYGQQNRSLSGYKGHLVTTSTIGEFGEDIADTARKKYKGIDVEVHILPGMDEQETAGYLANFSRQSQTGLSIEQIVKYSMGVPLLVHQLSQWDIDEQTAAQICAAYIKESFRPKYEQHRLFELSKPYLKIKMPDNIYSLVEEINALGGSKHIYDNLHYSLHKMEKLIQRGIFEEAPLFVAPESEKIYDSMLQNDGVASIDIFVPHLNSTDLIRIQQAFGFNDYRLQYLQNDATRAEMFLIEYRKVSFWHRDTNGNMIVDENELSYLESQALNYVKAYKKGSLGMRGSASRGSASFYIHAHGHHGETWHPATIGWMVESLLQQRGIAYFVNNGTYNASYIYRPDERHIEILPKRVEIERW